VAKIEIELGETDTQQLDAEVASRGTTRAALAQRWVEERLLHERDRAAGRAKPAAPRPGAES
jgi:hypothetical protein